MTWLTSTPWCSVKFFQGSFEFLIAASYLDLDTRVLEQTEMAGKSISEMGWFVVWMLVIVFVFRNFSTRGDKRTNWNHIAKIIFETKWLSTTFYQRPGLQPRTPSQASADLAQQDTLFHELRIHGKNQSLFVSKIDSIFSSQANSAIWRQMIETLACLGIIDPIQSSWFDGAFSL